MKALSLSEVQTKLETLKGWTLENHKLHREFKFKDFIAAFKFMTEIATAAEEMNHHPEWLNVYNRVTVDLTTHDAKGITEKDFKLAQKMNAHFKE
ncbi:MAG: putative pterin-4a-carbinolamine dehydratase [Bacteriovoracaceae bacterium]|nr:putative pterin-4a-carbinolamine dehydratase [Bacteriovoracaceae bacterium]